MLFLHTAFAAWPHDLPSFLRWNRNQRLVLCLLFLLNFFPLNCYFFCCLHTQMEFWLLICILTFNLLNGIRGITGVKLYGEIICLSVCIGLMIHKIIALALFRDFSHQPLYSRVMKFSGPTIPLNKNNKSSYHVGVSLKMWSQCRNVKKLQFFAVQLDVGFRNTGHCYHPRQKNRHKKIMPWNLKQLLTK